MAVVMRGVDRLAKRSYADIYNYLINTPSEYTNTVITQIEGRQHYLLQPQLSIPKHYQLLRIP